LQHPGAVSHPNNIPHPNPGAHQQQSPSNVAHQNFPAEGQGNFEHRPQNQDKQFSEGTQSEAPHQEGTLLLFCSMQTKA
jgi:hypothetical protein